MSRRVLWMLVTGWLLVALMVTVGCTPSDPIERIAQSRQDYTVVLNGFLIREPSVAEPEPMMEGEQAAGEMETEATPAPDEAEEDEGMEISGFEPEPVGPQPKNIFFDLLVGFDGSHPLPGLTVEISQIDPFQKEKATYRHYLDLTSLQSGSVQTDFVLENTMFEDGDGFSVDLRLVVPEAERGEYQEFAAAGS